MIRSTNSDNFSLSFIPEGKYADDNVDKDFIGYNHAADYDTRIMPCMSSLIDYLDDDDILRPKNHKETNIFDIQRGKCYSFIDKSDKLERYFNRLEECRRQGTIVMFAEKQNPDASGIMLDFDFKLKNPDKLNQITAVHKQRLAKLVIRILNAYFILDEYINQYDSIVAGITSSGKSNNFHLLKPQ